MTLKNLAPIFIFTGVAMLAAGCASSNFRPYSGVQKDWPTSPGCLMETNNAVPTYFGFPPRAYVVVGCLDETAAPICASRVVRYAASRAKALGGDAIIVLDQGRQYVGSATHGTAYVYGPGPGYGSETATYNGVSRPLYEGTASVLVIKFKSMDVTSNRAETDTAH